MQQQQPAQSAATRRTFVTDAVSAASAIAIAAAVPAVASAETVEVPRTTSRLGGLLEPYSDTGRAFKMFKPLGWNKFDAIPGEYDVKFTDIINPAEILTLSTTAVKSETTLEALGDVTALGEKLAKGRGAQLVGARDRRTDGIRFYDLEFVTERLHVLRTLCVYRGRLWSLEATTTARAWPKREATYRAVVDGFVPRL
ncbi:PsbP-domain-containing protein [Tribonema minus]|uniref:PsbP-domain-containing protein n=1 Tax=Tribonema minus TaxID=303371 RepID=A0A836C6X8_9STRA|nr:PsbP-domain-containing protein [Tribonema minus]